MVDGTDLTQAGFLERSRGSVCSGLSNSHRFFEPVLAHGVECARGGGGSGTAPSGGAGNASGSASGSGSVSVSGGKDRAVSSAPVASPKEIFLAPRQLALPLPLPLPLPGVLVRQLLLLPLPLHICVWGSLT